MRAGLCCIHSPINRLAQAEESSSRFELGVYCKRQLTSPNPTPWHRPREVIYHCQLQVMQRELQDQEVSSLADGHRGSETEPRAWGCLGSSTPLSLREGLCPDDLEFVLAWSDACQKHFADAKENFVQSLQTWPGSSCWVPGLKWGLPWREAEDECLPFFSLRDFLKFMARDCEAVRATTFHEHGVSDRDGLQTHEHEVCVDARAAISATTMAIPRFVSWKVPQGNGETGQILSLVSCRRSPAQPLIHAKAGNGEAGQDLRLVLSRQSPAPKVTVVAGSGEAWLCARFRADGAQQALPCKCWRATGGLG